MRAVLFDLDGTLIDSLPDLAGALNALLARRGLAPLPQSEVAGMIGNGVEKLVERGYRARGVGLDEPGLAAEAAAFHALYEPRATRETRLFPGVRPALAALRDAGTPAAVVTNKIESATRLILSAFGIEELFTTVVGGDAEPPKKPAPGMLLLACKRLGVRPDEAVMVGDSINDIAAARAAGIGSIAMRHGYTTIPPEDLGADLVLDDFGGLPEALRALEGRR